MNAYLVIDIAIHDLEVFSKYIQEIPKFIEKHSGRYVVQGEEPTVMEGSWKPERLVVIEFPSKDNAEFWGQYTYFLTTGLRPGLLGDSFSPVMTSNLRTKLVPPNGLPVRVCSSIKSSSLLLSASER